MASTAKKEVNGGRGVSAESGNKRDVATAKGKGQANKVSHPGQGGQACRGESALAPRFEQKKDVL